VEILEIGSTQTGKLRPGLMTMSAVVLLLGLVLSLCAATPAFSRTADFSIPLLSITNSGGQAVVSWPPTAAGWTLQTNGDLASGSWVHYQGVVSNDAVIMPVVGTLFFRLALTNGASSTNTVPVGMVLIAGGTFPLGDTLDGIYGAAPVTASVSTFCMDTNLVTCVFWTNVYTYATANGYSFASPGSGLGSNQPVVNVDWFDCVKWCNARSQQAGLTPVYHTDAALTQVYTNGEPATVYPNWSAQGFRLPTEAEWEYAARGGLVGQRFPWGLEISEGGRTSMEIPQITPTISGPTDSTPNLPSAITLLPAPRDHFSQTGMDCSTWRATSGSGAGTGMAPTAAAPIHVGRRRTWTVCYAAAVGRLKRKTAARGIEAPPPRGACPTTPGSARSCPQVSERQGDAFETERRKTQTSLLGGVCFKFSTARRAMSV